MSENLCSFGCERVSIKQLKNGRFLCCEFVSQCPVMRQRNSSGRRGKNPWVEHSHPRGMAGKPAWNKGRSFEQSYDSATAERLRECSRKAAMRMHQLWDPKSKAEAQRRAKLSDVAKKRQLGQYRRGSGRGKKGWFRGYWCDSSYELAFVIYALDQGFAFERNWKSFPYTFEGRPRTWIPDFRLTDGTYLEIKGYLSPQAEAKFGAFPDGLIVVRRENMQFVFDYVLKTYGRDFVRLYE